MACVIIPQIFFSLSSIALLALSTVPFTFAFEEIDIAYSVAANTDTNVQIVNDLSRGANSYDAQFSSYRVYLSIQPPGWALSSACYLVGSSGITTTSLTVQIPASVGPSDSIYSITTLEFPFSTYYPNYNFSNTFTLTGATGTWSPYELAGHIIGDLDRLPCTAYDCARQCSQKFYPANVDNENAAYQTDQCVGACPGVDASGYGYGTGNNTTTMRSSASSASSSSPPSLGTTITSTAAGGTGVANSTVKTSTTGAGTSKTSSASTSVTASGTTSASTPSASGSVASGVSFSVLAAFLGFFFALVEI